MCWEASEGRANDGGRGGRKQMASVRDVRSLLRPSGPGLSLRQRPGLKGVD